MTADERQVWAALQREEDRLIRAYARLEKRAAACTAELADLKRRHRELDQRIDHFLTAVGAVDVVH